MENEIDLKPCPFCGRIPIFKTYKFSDRKTRYWITCINFKCGVKPSTEMVFTKKAAVSAWNERAGT